MTSDSASPHVSVIIVNYNGLHDTLECLRSVSRISYPHHDVVVVDNRSDRDELEAIRVANPSVVLIQNLSNAGYAGAVDIGVKASFALDSEYVVILNNDTTVDHLFISHLVEAARRSDTIGVVGARIMYYSHPEIIWSTGGRLLVDIGLQQEAGQNQLSPPSKGIAARDWVSGCAMLVKSRVLKLMPYGGNYRTDADDVEFCIRVRNLGMSVTSCQDSVVYHKVSRTKAKRPMVLRPDPFVGVISRHARHKNLALLSYLLIFRTARILNYVIRTPDKALRGYYARKIIYEIALRTPFRYSAARAYMG
ncbi:MAG: glycosyltransferase family 2 protein [Nitrososphaerota archaeon]|nr:glycosyltransferase family 2 protein [Nitrososphaerota archaeon]